LIACEQPRLLAKRPTLVSDHRKMLASQTVTIDYTNWRGERAVRRIIPEGICFVANEWHPTEQWIMTAIDVDKGGEVRTFAIAQIHSWTAV
jgi:hypothetical protein